MRLKTLLLAGILGFVSTAASAQAWVEDSVEMGPGYTSDIFYSLKNGAQPAVPNTNWHLAFQMTPPGPYGNVSILANQVQGMVNVYSLHLSASSNFASLSAGDTVGKTGAALALNNSDSTWNLGAFNRMNDASNPFDYSWGIYNMVNHKVVGDSLYLVTVGASPNVTAYKVHIQHFVSTPADSVHWQFRIAKFDGSEDTTVRIYRKPGYTDRLFAYYNIDTKTVSDREPSRSAWDVLFTRYVEYIPGAPGVPHYPVMGLLANFDVSVLEKQHAGPDDTLGFGSYTYSDRLNAIGSDWKTFTPPFGPWTLADSTYFFVKTKNTNEFYQLQFTGFGGSADGKVVFRKRFLGNYVNAVTGVNSGISYYKLVPNPAASDVTVVMDTKNDAKNARLQVTDLQGRTVFTAAVDVRLGLNTFNINTASTAPGTYMVMLTGNGWRATEKLIIQH